jgi:hypothetical protein
MGEFERGLAQLGIAPRFLLTCLVFLAISTIAISSGRAESTAAVEGAKHSASAPFFELPYIYKDAREDELEFGTARSDHISLALMIVNRCFPGLNDPIKWSTQVKAMLLLGLNERLGHDPVPSDATGTNSHLDLKNWFQGAALSYSDRLSRDRLYYQRGLIDSRARAAAFQYALAIVAALATVLVGIKAIWPENLDIFWKRVGIVIGITALIASASVTALTTLNSFYGSQDEATRDQRTVAQLRQLHWRIINDVESDRNLCIAEQDLYPPSSQPHTGDDTSVDEINKTLIGLVTSWKDRFETILNDALPNLSKPGDLAKPGDVRPGRPGDIRPGDPIRPGGQTKK